MISFLCFVLLCWGLCFLVADAHIFGCDATGYSATDPTCQEKGIFKVRQKLLKHNFFREQLKCYFCIGIWLGLPVHVVLRDFFKESYWLWHAPTTIEWLEGLGIASVVSAACSYIINRVIEALEAFALKP